MKKFIALKLPDVVFIMLLNANNCWHFNIYEQDKFLLSWGEYENSYITSGPEVVTCRQWINDDFNIAKDPLYMTYCL